MRLVAASARDALLNQLTAAGRAATDGMVVRERLHLDTLRRLAFTAGVPEAVANNDEAALKVLLGPLVLNDRIEVLTVFNQDGLEEKTFILNPDGLSFAESRNVDLATEPLVANVLRATSDELGDKFAGIRQLGSGAYLFTSAPVRDSTGAVVGGLLMGTRLDTLLRTLEEQSGADIVALDATGRLVATTIGSVDEGPAALELLSEQAAALTGEQLEERTINGRKNQLLYTPLVVRQETVGILAVGLADDYIVSNEITSRTTFAGIFGVGTGLMILFGLLLAQHIGGPILRLRDVSQAVAGGDLRQTTGVQRSDEIGELADSFDVMTGRLRERTEEARRLYQETVRRNQELREINARLQSTQQQLIQSEKLAAVGQLTAGIVHDVKNPLAVIKGLAEILQEEDGLNGFVREQLTLIRDNASRANTIVSDLLKFARQSTPEMGLRDLRETLQAALRLTEYLVRKGHIQSRLELPAEAVLVTYDAQQIEQVLINLIQNSLQAMPNGGELVLGLERAGDHVILTVRDTGVGIAPENLTRVFDPFFTTKPEGEGTGLGLSVSYGIVARHHGEIMVDSVLGQGTAFIIRLPVNQPETPLPTGV
jgi:signal transduction histidine kinase